MTYIQDIYVLEAVSGGDCYTAKIRINLGIVQIEGTLTIGDCSMS